MSKLWQVALQEYRRHVFTRRFIFGLLSVPLVIILLVGLVFLVTPAVVLSCFGAGPPAMNAASSS